MGKIIRGKKEFQRTRGRLGFFERGYGKWSSVGNFKREERKSKGQGSLEEVREVFKERIQI